MTFDPSTRRLVGLMDELGAGDDGYIDDILARTATMGQRPVWTFGPRRSPLTPRRATALVALGAILTLVVGTAAYVASRPAPAVPSTTVSNGWIAFSTMPGIRQVGSTDFATGSDLYIVRPGEEKIRIADRLGGIARNVCPAFSPDGTMLAYGTSRGGERALVVVAISDAGSVTDLYRIPIPGLVAPGDAPCPHWSRDGRRLVYLEGGRPVVHRLDGSRVDWTEADPGIAEFATLLDAGASPNHAEAPLLSPAGDLIAEAIDECAIRITATDGSGSRVIPSVCGYSLAAWSPDGAQILVMQDVSGRHFTMDAVPADGTSPIVAVAAMVPTNGARSWPGRGDVAWQPVFD